MYADDFLIKDYLYDMQIKKADPVIQICSLMVVALNIFGHVSRSMCNMVLGMLSLTLRCAWSSGGASPSSHANAIIDAFPDDVRGVKKRFNLSPITIIYATCPLCSCIHKPTVSSSDPTQLVYPLRCTNRRSAKSPICNSLLLKSAVNHKQESIQVPIRPYIYQKFAHFQARLLSRPGVEAAIERSMKIKPSGDLYIWDIYQGEAVQRLQGPDSQSFLCAPPGELRIIWSLNIDWFNPYTNKASGKAVSAGEISMLCLSLPPSLRCDFDNIYLAGIIPTPREPSNEQTNHFIYPIVDELKVSYSAGHTYSRTHDSPAPRKVRSAMVVLANDLPAARKIAGQAGHGAACFCPLCQLQLSNINEVDQSKWGKPRTREQYMAIALKWKNATTLKERKGIFKETGIRWSPLLELEYFNPLLSVVIDPMHTLFLNNVHHLIRTVLAIDTSIKPDPLVHMLTPPTEKNLQHARKIVTKNLQIGTAHLVAPQATRSQLEVSLRRMTMNVLYTLCLERGIECPLSGPDGKARKIKKDELVALLLVSINGPRPLLVQMAQNLLGASYNCSKR